MKKKKNPERAARLFLNASQHSFPMAIIVERPDQEPLAIYRESRASKPILMTWCQSWGPLTIWAEDDELGTRRAASWEAGQETEGRGDMFVMWGPNPVPLLFVGFGSQEQAEQWQA